MERVLLTIEYDGTAYAGWQRQQNARGIQQVVEDAITKLQQAPAVLFASGRTDAGVHALGQCAHFDSVCTIPPEKWRYVLNNVLPADIRVKESRRVPEDFHARYWVKDKTYQYVLYRGETPPAILRNQVGYVSYPLDVGAMKRAAKALLGTHDFAGFMAAHSGQGTTVRTIYDVRWKEEGQALFFFIRGNGFLRNMVRIIMGTLMDIGRGRLPETVISEAIRTKERSVLGDTAPACGLYLKEVRYYPSREEKEACRESLVIQD